MRVRATVGEVSELLASVYGRYKAGIETIHSVYSQVMGEDAKFRLAVAELKVFVAQQGRPPRILVGKLGQDGHDRGAKVIATGLSDIGFDVDMGSLFQTPKELAKQAIENDVHVIGVSSQAAGHKTLIPQLMAELKSENSENMHVVVGGVIPKQDYDFLKEQGVAAIFGPGTSISDCALGILKALQNKES